MAKNSNSSKNKLKKTAEELEREHQEFLEKYQPTENVYQDENTILKTEIDFLDITGVGRNQKEAYGDVFKKLKEQIYKKHNNFIIHLQPRDVIPLKDNSNLKVQRVLGLMPHRKLSWEVTLRIVYEVKFINEL